MTTTSRTRRAPLALAVVLAIITSMLALVAPAQAGNTGTLKIYQDSACATNANDPDIQSPYYMGGVDFQANAAFTITISVQGGQDGGTVVQTLTGTTDSVGSFCAGPVDTGPGHFKAEVTGPAGEKSKVYWIGDAQPQEVQAAPPTFTDPTCEVQDADVTYTDTDEYYYTVSGTVAPGEKVTVTATAKDGYTLTGETSWKHTFTALAELDCTEPPQEVQATPPTFTDPTCEVQDADVTYTETDEYYYTVSGTVAPGEKVTVTATAKDGYTLTGETSWKHTFTALAELDCTEPPQEVQAATPTFTDPTCTTAASVTAPSTDSYTFTITGTVAPGQKVTATATAKDGYTLTGQTSWEHTFSTPTGCTPPPTVVSAAPVAFVNPTCDAPNAGVQFSNTAQYTYAVTSGTVAPSQTVTVTATATAGYALTGQTTWTHSYTAVPTNCTAVGGVEETTDETAVEAVEDESTDEVVVAGVEELASTGGNLGPAGLGLLLVLVGAAFVGARRFAQR